MTIREATADDAAAIARVHVDSWRSTYEGIVPADYLENLSYDDHEGFWQALLARYGETNFVYVAENARGEVVGFASGGPERDGGEDYDAEVYTLYVLDDHQRKGFGKQLTHAVTSRLKAGGFKSVVLWVLEDNPACGFYESLGGKRVKQEDANIGGADLSGIAFAWDDIDALVAGSKSSFTM